ncbi:MAG: ectonucleotide pyrophosphatase/phosphodiesterase, partial [Bdellovibrionales bacterium]|nr:ectonucleotide pyrophosphatase/phosphodiesterase [Bdellovibrionales bacterium]
GVVATQMTPVFPSLTFPNHYTQVTGLHPQNHGIVNNTMDDPSIPGRFSLGNGAVMRDPRWWKGEPFWTTVEKFGAKAGTMFWPGSDVEINGDRPTYYKSFDKNVNNLERVKQVLAWLDLPPSERPRFLTLYFEEADSAGHKFGPGSPQVGQALQSIDAAVGALVVGLQERKLLAQTNVLIVSDHGMTETAPAKAIRVDQLSSVTPEEVINGGGLMGLLPKTETRRMALYKELKGAHPNMQVFLREEMPERYVYRNSVRIPPLLLVSDDGYYMTTRPGFNFGSHGFDPQNASMKAVFIGYGPLLLKKTIVPEYQTVDVYELMAMLMNVQPAKNDGSFQRAAKVVNGRTICRVPIFQNLQLKRACRARSTAMKAMGDDSDSRLDADLLPESFQAAY